MLSRIYICTIKINQMTINKFYTEKEISKRLRITIQSLCKLRKNNNIDFIKVGNSVRYPEHVYNGILLNPVFAVHKTSLIQETV